MSLRTYIVEDSPTIRTNLIETLHELADVRAVGTSETERESVGWLTSHGTDWDLAIIDLFLREGSGMNVLAACGSGRHGGQAMVVLTNHATDEIRRRCLALGADAVFDKSTEVDELIDWCRARTREPAAH